MDQCLTHKRANIGPGKQLYRYTHIYIYTYIHTYIQGVALKIDPLSSKTILMLPKNFENKKGSILGGLFSLKPQTESSLEKIDPLHSI